MDNKQEENRKKEIAKEIIEQKRELYQEVKKQLEGIKQSQGVPSMPKQSDYANEALSDAQINEYGEIVRPGR